MLLMLTIVSSILGLAASVLSLVSFYRDQLRHRTLLMIITLGFATTVILLLQYVNEERRNKAIEQVQLVSLARDAKVVSDAIIISGWEYPGDYLGYLSQIVGFYKRHMERYPSEYQTYSRQLTEWQEFLKQAREEKRSLYSSDTRDLEGLVKAGRKQLSEIASQLVK